MLRHLACSVALTASLAFGGAALANADAVLATQNGFTLTRGHFEREVEIERALSGDASVSEIEIGLMKTELIEEFYADPAATLKLIDEVYADIFSGENGAIDPELLSVAAPAPATELAPAQEFAPAPTFQATTQAAGHSQMRETLGNFVPIAQLASDAFTAPDVNQLRSFIGSSQLVSANFNDYSSGEHVYTFCPGGTFIYYYGSSTSIPGSDAGVSLSGIHEDEAVGVWDAYHEGGQIMLLLYSNMPAFVDQSINNTGLLAMPIAHFEADVVQLGPRGLPPSTDNLLPRTQIAGC